MNAVNRILIVVLLLIVMVLCTISLVVPVRVFDAVAREATVLADSLRGFERYSPGWFGRVFLGLLFALTLDIIFGLFIILEVRRSAPRAIRVKQATGGEVTISIASIADRLKEEISYLPGVLSSSAKVSAKRRGVLVELDVKMAAGTSVPEKAEKIVETARQVVEEKMGLELARPPKVNLRALPHPRAPSAPKSRPESVVVDETVDEAAAEQSEG